MLATTILQRGDLAGTVSIEDDRLVENRAREWSPFDLGTPGCNIPFIVNKHGCFLHETMVQ